MRERGEGEREGEAILCRGEQSTGSKHTGGESYGRHFAHTPSASHMDWRKVEPHVVHEDGKSLSFLYVSEALRVLGTARPLSTAHAHSGILPLLHRSVTGQWPQPKFEGE